MANHAFTVGGVTTTIVNTDEAKSRLSELIRSVEDGEEVIVARLEVLFEGSEDSAPW